MDRPTIKEEVAHVAVDPGRGYRWEHRVELCLSEVYPILLRLTHMANAVSQSHEVESVLARVVL